MKAICGCLWLSIVLLASGCAAGGKIILCGMETPSVDGGTASRKTVWAVISEPRKVQRVVLELAKLGPPPDTGEFIESSPMVMNLFVTDRRSLRVESVYWVQRNRVSGIRGQSMYAPICDYVTSVEPATQSLLRRAIAGGLDKEGHIDALVSRGHADGFVAADADSMSSFRDRISAWAGGDEP